MNASLCALYVEISQMIKSNCCLHSIFQLNFHLNCSNWDASQMVSNEFEVVSTISNSINVVCVCVFSFCCMCLWGVYRTILSSIFKHYFGLEITIFIIKLLKYFTYHLHFSSHHSSWHP